MQFDSDVIINGHGPQGTAYYLQASPPRKGVRGRIAYIAEGHEPEDFKEVARMIVENTVAWLCQES